MLRILHLNLPPTEQPVFPTGIKTDPSDDFTYRLQYARPNCRVDIDIRQQVRSDGDWRSLPVITERRPSLSEEARQQAVRQRLGDPALRKDAKPMTPSDLDKINEMLKPKGPPRWGASTFSMGFPFEEAPRPCLEAFGEYRLAKNSFALAFFAPLPAELNKFVMEGADLDETHGRIYLTRDDCRFEFTISQSAIRDGQPVAIPLRPVPDGGNARPVDIKP
jgi:hypothetical protein